MPAHNYLFLFIFTAIFAAAYTFTAYCLTHNPWMSTFVTAAGALVFFLENMELNRTVKDLEGEIITLRTSTHFTLIPKINDLQTEIKQLKAYITYQNEGIDDNNARRLKRHSKSTGQM